MKRVYVEELSQHAGQDVEIAGWLYNQRGSGKILFLLLRDGTGIVQSVISKKEVDETSWEIANSLTQETSIIIRGKVNKDERAPGGYELWITGLEKVGDSEDYPISLKEHGTTFMLDHRHLAFRSKKPHAILRIRHEIISAIRDFFNGRGFINFDTPIFTPNAVEGLSLIHI